MFFCDREAVRAVLEGKSVALVGSGPGVLRNRRGVVDSHDVVVRVNNFKLVPGSGTGRRTDVFYSFFGQSIRKTAGELYAGGVRLCMAKCPDAKFIDSPWHEANGKVNGIDFRPLYARRAGWWFCPTYVPTVPEFMQHFDLLGGHVPTTGFSALLDVLRYGPREVFVTGFDFFASGVHNVNEQWRKNNPDDPIGHVPAVERAWFVKNAPDLPITLDDTLARIVRRGRLAA